MYIACVCVCVCMSAAYVLVSETHIVKFMMHFILQANCPDASKIPAEDVLGVTVVLLTCSYRDNEFVRIGYYVNNEYTDSELNENPPAQPVFQKVYEHLPYMPSKYSSVKE